MKYYFAVVQHLINKACRYCFPNSGQWIAEVMYSTQYYFVSYHKLSSLLVHHQVGQSWVPSRGTYSGHCHPLGKSYKIFLQKYEEETDYLRQKVQNKNKILMEDGKKINTKGTLLTHFNFLKHSFTVWNMIFIIKTQCLPWLAKTTLV